MGMECLPAKGAERHLGVLVITHYARILSYLKPDSSTGTLVFTNGRLTDYT